MKPRVEAAPLKIGEVARLLKVSTSLLRFWETEFKVLRPKKTRSQQRLYGAADVEQLREIKRLLKVEGYTIAGARRQLAKKSKDRVAELGRELEAARRALTAAESELSALRGKHAALRSAVERETALLANLAEE